MKVIGAKSLVQIAPSVTEVGERPSPGVFDFNRGEPPSISCDGALNITELIDISGDWKLEVDGELVRPEATSIDDLIAYLIEAGFEVTTEPDTPTISCDGAVDYVRYYTFMPIDKEYLPPEELTLLIDGVPLPTTGLPPEWLQVEGADPITPPEGYKHQFAGKFKNMGADNHRLEMVVADGSLWKIFMENSSNTVVEVEPYKHYGVCLSPAEIVEPPWDIKFVNNGETVYRLTGPSISNNYADNAPGGNIGTEYIDVTSLTFGGNVNSIGSTSFRGWQNAQELIIEDGLKSIGDYAFYFWSSITQVVIPASVTHIGRDAFGYWESCNSFTFLSTTPPTIGGTIIHNVAPNTKIYVPASAVDAYKNDAGWSFYANDIFAIQ